MAFLSTLWRARVPGDSDVDPEILADVLYIEEKVRNQRDSLLALAKILVKKYPDTFWYFPIWKIDDCDTDSDLVNLMSPAQITAFLQTEYKDWSDCDLITELRLSNKRDDYTFIPFNGDCVSMILNPSL